MPNHVKQLLTVEGRDAFARLNAYFTDFDVVGEFNGKREQWRSIDFGKIIARPAIVDTITENGADRYIPFLMNLDGAYLLWEQLRASKWPQLKERPLMPWQGFESMRDGWMEKQLRHTFGDDIIENAYRMIRCFAETGSMGWYGWSVKHWETKWNAYDCGDLKGEGDVASVRFTTAWCCPEKLLKKLAEREPDLHFSYVAFCEGTEFYAIGGGTAGQFDITTERYPIARTPEMIADYVRVYDREPDPDEEDDAQDEDSPAQDASDV